MKSARISLSISILLLLSTQALANPVGIGYISQTHHIQGSAGYEVNATYDYDSNDTLSASADGSSTYFGPDHSEAEAGDLGVYAEATGVFSWATAKSTYVFNVSSEDLTLHTWGYSLSGGLPDESQSTIKLTDLTLNQELLFDDFVYQPAVGEPVGAGSFYSFDNEYEFLLNKDHIYELSMESFTNTGQGGIYESLLHADMSAFTTVPEPSTLLLLVAGLAGGSAFSRRKVKLRRQ